MNITRIFEFYLIFYSFLERKVITLSSLWQGPLSVLIAAALPQPTPTPKTAIPLPSGLVG